MHGRTRWISRFSSPYPGLRGSAGTTLRRESRPTHIACSRQSPGDSDRQCDNASCASSSSPVGPMHWPARCWWRWLPLPSDGGSNHRQAGSRGVHALNGASFWLQATVNDKRWDTPYRPVVTVGSWPGLPVRGQRRQQSCDWAQPERPIYEATTQSPDPHQPQVAFDRLSGCGHSPLADALVYCAEALNSARASSRSGVENPGVNCASSGSMSGLTFPLSPSSCQSRARPFAARSS